MALREIDSKALRFLDDDWLVLQSDMGQLKFAGFTPLGFEPDNYMVYVMSLQELNRGKISMDEFEELGPWELLFVLPQGARTWARGECVRKHQIDIDVIDVSSLTMFRLNGEGE